MFLVRGGGHTAGTGTGRMHGGDIERSPWQRGAT